MMGGTFILGALTVLGGDTLTDFALELLVDLAVGTYSSVFTATPLAITAEARWPSLPAGRPVRVRDARR